MQPFSNPTPKPSQLLNGTDLSRTIKWTYSITLLLPRNRGRRQTLLVRGLHNHAPKLQRRQQSISDLLTTQRWGSNRNRHVKLSNLSTKWYWVCLTHCVRRTFHGPVITVDEDSSGDDDNNTCTVICAGLKRKRASSIASTLLEVSIHMTTRSLGTC